MSLNVHRSFIALMLLSVVGSPLSAAVSTSALTGRVTSGGKAVANATITATSPALLHERVTTTGSNGTYWLGALPPGNYEVTFASKGLQTLTRRAVVELARVARADAQLEPSEDEESVTSTATTISVVHDTALTFHRDAKSLDLLPMPITLSSALYLAPASFSTVPATELDELPIRVTENPLVDETAEELTFVRGVTPLEYVHGGDTAIAARTRSGGETLSVSVRDTITSGAWLGEAFRFVRDDGGPQHFLESSSGGRIVPNRLWFFAAGWGGSRADGTPLDRRGVELKLTAQLDERQNLAATFIDDEIDFAGSGDQGSSLFSLVHIAQWNPRVISEIAAGRSRAELNIGPFPVMHEHEDSVSAKASFVAGDHVLSGGVDYSDSDSRALFVSDRLWLDRWVVNAGVRYGGNGSTAFPSNDNELSAQVAATYDLRGRGRNAVTASATRYSSNIDELTLGYIMALGSTGSARLIAIRKEFENAFAFTALQLDSSYRLFDRFEAGLNYTYTDTYRDRFPVSQIPSHVANAWFSAEIPLGTQSLGAMVAYRYSNASSIDLALRYTVPVKRVALTFAADALNVFDQGVPLQYPRVVRGWVRVRL
jgi:hypothetical protein